MSLISNFISENKKMIGFSSKFPLISVRSERDFFLECDAYNITIPVKTKPKSCANFSIIEQCVLRLLKINSNYSDREIAEKLCLGTYKNNNSGNEYVDTSLIKIIRARLEDLELIDSSGSITETGLQTLQSASAISAQETERISAQVFCIRQLNNKLLSYIHIGAIESESFDNERFKISMKYGSAGKEEIRKGTLIPIRRDKSKEDFIANKVPTQNEIIRAISKYNRLCSPKNVIKYYVSNGGIEILPVPESVIIHMKAVIQNGNACEPIISDGFSCNIDGVLNYVKSKTEIIKELFERDSKITEESDNLEEKIVHREYSEIFYALKKVKIAQGDSIDSNQIAKNTNSGTIQGCYSALEWTFHYYLNKKIDISRTIKVLSEKSSVSNITTILEYAKRFNLNIPETTRSLSGAEKNGIEKWITGCKSGDVVPEIKVLLPVLICYTYLESDALFRNLIIDIPDFLIIIEKLHALAAEIRHEGSSNMSCDEVNKYVMFTKKIVEMLIPEINFGEKDEINIKSDVSSQYFVNNTVKLTEIIGWDLWNSLDEKVKKLLFELSPENDKDINLRLSPMDFVSRVSQILEEMLYEEIRYMNISEKCYERTALFNKIEERTGNKQLPEGYYLVGENYLNKAVHQGKSTLNAMALVYFANADENVFNNLFKIGIVEYVIYISQLRRHGNVVNLVLNDKEKSEIREKLFEILKIIGG